VPSERGYSSPSDRGGAEQALWRGAVREPVGEPTSDVIDGMEAVSVHIRDIKRARKFYTEVLGLKEIAYSEEYSRAQYSIPGSSSHLTMHVMGDGEGGREPGTVSGIIFTHADPYAAFERIKQRGGSVVSEPHEVVRPGATFILGVFADPDGNEFVLRALKK